jgi:hypothetical protein
VVGGASEDVVITMKREMSPKWPKSIMTHSKGDTYNSSLPSSFYLLRRGELNTLLSSRKDKVGHQIPGYDVVFNNRDLCAWVVSLFPNYSLAKLQHPHSHAERFISTEYKPLMLARKTETT